MLTISKEQLIVRYDSLPDILKEALFSDEDDTAILAISASHHLPDDKTVLMARIVGDVILGFIYPDDLPKELAADLKIDARLAQTLAQEIEQKIFSKIRADLERNYKPLSEIETLDLRAAKPTAAVPEQIQQKVEELKPEEFKILYTHGEEAKPEEREKASIAPLGAPLPETPKEEPLIIRKEEELKTVSIKKPTLGGLFGFLKGEQPQKPREAPAVAARVILTPQPPQLSGAGPLSGPPETGIARTEQPKMKIVHFSSFAVPESPFGKTEIPTAPSEEKLPEPPKEMVIPPIEPVKEKPKEEIQLKDIPVEPSNVHRDALPGEEEVIDLRTMEIKKSTNNESATN